MNLVASFSKLFSFMPWPPNEGWRSKIFSLETQAKSVHRRLNTFRARVYIPAGLVLVASSFNIFSPGLLRAISAIGFLILAELLVASWYSNLQTRSVDWFRIVFRLVTRRGIEKQPLPSEMKAVAEGLRLDVREMWIMDKLENAFSLPAFKVIVVGRPLLGLPATARNAVITHELAHVRGRHNLLNLFPLFALMPQLVIWRSLPIQMLILAAFAYYLIASIPMSWMGEIFADGTVRKILGANAMIEALELVCHGKMQSLSETHPSPASRIKLLRKGTTHKTLFALWLVSWLVGSWLVVLVTL